MQSVRLDVWRVRRRDVAAAVVAGRRDVARLRRDRAVTFAKLLGTASATFLPTGATPTRWALLACRTGGGHSDGIGDHYGTWWDKRAVERATLSLQPLSSRGQWDGVTPFATGGGREWPNKNWQGAVLALTRSTLRPKEMVAFYRAVPPIAAEVARAHGCRIAFGIGEAPLVRQGTISIWDSAADVTAFAHSAPAHVAAVERTPRQGWYAEELFARFAIVDAAGSIDGVSINGMPIDGVAVA